MSKTYIVAFRRHKDQRPSKFIVLADSMKQAINIAWDHGGTEFQSLFDKTIALKANPKISWEKNEALDAIKKQYMDLLNCHFTDETVSKRGNRPNPREPA